MEGHPVPLTDPRRVEPAGHSTDLVDQLAVAQGTIQILTAGRSGPPPGLLEDGRQEVGRPSARSSATGAGLGPAHQLARGAPRSGVPSSKVTAPRFTVHR